MKQKNKKDSRTIPFQEIEKKWQTLWEKRQEFRTENTLDKEKFFDVLSEV